MIWVLGWVFSVFVRLLGFARVTADLSLLGVDIIQGVMGFCGQIQVCVQGAVGGLPGVLCVMFCGFVSFAFAMCWGLRVCLGSVLELCGRGCGWGILGQCEFSLLVLLFLGCGFCGFGFGWGLVGFVGDGGRGLAGLCCRFLAERCCDIGLQTAICIFQVDVSRVLGFALGL